MNTPDSIDRVLLIDDDADDRMFFKDAVSEINPALVCELTSNGYEALNRLSTEPLPKMIFLDLNMPIMSGFDCLLEIKKRDQLKDIPVIIFTTTSDQKAMKRSQDLGASAYFKKPNDYPSLMAKLHSLLMMDFTRKAQSGHSFLSFAI